MKLIQYILSMESNQIQNNSNNQLYISNINQFSTENIKERLQNIISLDRNNINSPNMLISPLHALINILCFFKDSSVHFLQDIYSIDYNFHIQISELLNMKILYQLYYDINSILINRNSSEQSKFKILNISILLNQFFYELLSNNIITTKNNMQNFTFILKNNQLELYSKTVDSILKYTSQSTDVFANEYFKVVSIFISHIITLSQKINYNNIQFNDNNMSKLPLLFLFSQNPKYQSPYIVINNVLELYNLSLQNIQNLDKEEIKNLFNKLYYSQKNHQPLDMNMILKELTKLELLQDVNMYIKSRQAILAKYAVILPGFEHNNCPYNDLITLHSDHTLLHTDSLIIDWLLQLVSYYDEINNDIVQELNNMQQQQEQKVENAKTILKKSILKGISPKTGLIDISFCFFKYGETVFKKSENFLSIDNNLLSSLILDSNLSDEDKLCKLFQNSKRNINIKLHILLLALSTSNNIINTNVFQLSFKPASEINEKFDLTTMNNLWYHSKPLFMIMYLVDKLLHTSQRIKPSAEGKERLALTFIAYNLILMCIKFGFFDIVIWNLEEYDNIETPNEPCIFTSFINNEDHVNAYSNYINSRLYNIHNKLIYANVEFFSSKTSTLEMINHTVKMNRIGSFLVKEEPNDVDVNFYLSMLQPFLKCQCKFDKLESTFNITSRCCEEYEFCYLSNNAIKKDIRYTPSCPRGNDNLVNFNESMLFESILQKNHENINQAIFKYFAKSNNPKKIIMHTLDINYFLTAYNKNSYETNYEAYNTIFVKKMISAVNMITPLLISNINIKRMLSFIDNMNISSNQRSCHDKYIIDFSIMKCLSVYHQSFHQTVMPSAYFNRIVTGLHDMLNNTPYTMRKLLDITFNNYNNSYQEVGLANNTLNKRIESDLENNMLNKRIESENIATQITFNETQLLEEEAKKKAEHNSLMQLYKLSTQNSRRPVPRVTINLTSDAKDDQYSTFTYSLAKQ